VILDRYVLRELGFNFAGTAAVLLAVFVTFTLTRLLAEAGSGLLTPAEVRELARLKALIALEVLLPVALYVAVLLCIGRLHQDAELHALGAAGIPESRLLRPVLFFALPLALVVALLSTQLRPWAWGNIYTLRSDAENSAEIDRVEAGSFNRFGESERTIYIAGLTPDRSGLEGVFIHDNEDGVLQIITAPRGSFRGYAAADRHELLLQDATVYRRNSEGQSLRAHFGSLRLWLKASGRHRATYKEKAQSTPALARTQNPSGRAEWQWRYSTPLSTVLLALLAVPLARSAPRRSRYLKLLIALLVYAAYYNLLGIARSAVEQQQLTWLWWVPSLLGIAVVLVHLWPQLRAAYARRTHA
jgi:lipopolysaccharide export system permease protein